MSIRELLREQIEILKNTMQKDVAKGDYYDKLVDVIEGDNIDLRVYLNNAGVLGEIDRMRCCYARGYIRGVAEERNMTIIELLEDENLP